MSSYLSTDQLIEELQTWEDAVVWSTMGLEWHPESASARYWVRRWWAYVIPGGVNWEPWPEGGEWDYGTWRFTRLQVSLAEIIELLRGWQEQDGGRFRDLDLQFENSQHVSWQESSQWAYSSPQMRHRLIPFAAKLLQCTDLNWSHQSGELGPLASDGLPYFPSVREAMRWWVDGLNPFSLGSDRLSGQDFGVWIIDRSARMRHVRIKAKSVEVDVEGVSEHSVSVSMYSLGTVGLPPQQVSQDGTVTFPISRTFHKAEWVVSVGRKILDRKFFSETAHLAAGFAVEVESADDERVEEWILQGENETTEFKWQIPDGHTKDVNKEWDEFLESAVAFANTNGGRILVGVDDHGQVVGVVRPDEVIQKIHTRFHANITPSVDFDCAVVEMQGFEDGPRKVVVATVQPGPLPAYAIERGTAPPKFFIRRGSSDLPAIREELERLFLSRNG